MWDDHQPFEQWLPTPTIAWWPQISQGIILACMDYHIQLHSHLQSHVQRMIFAWQAVYGIVYFVSYFAINVNSLLFPFAKFDFCWLLAPPCPNRPRSTSTSLALAQGPFTGPLTVTFTVALHGCTAEIWEGGKVLVWQVFNQPLSVVSSGFHAFIFLMDFDGVLYLATALS